jgi:hypothetical protein
MSSHLNRTGYKQVLIILVKTSIAVGKCWNSYQLCKNKRLKLRWNRLWAIFTCQIKKETETFHQFGMGFFGPILKKKSRKRDGKRYGLSLRVCTIHGSILTLKDSCGMSIREFAAGEVASSWNLLEDDWNLKAELELQKWCWMAHKLQVPQCLQADKVEFLNPQLAYGILGTVNALIKTAMRVILKRTLINRNAVDRPCQKQEAIVNSRAITCPRSTRMGELWHPATFWWDGESLSPPGKFKKRVMCSLRCGE